MTAPLLPLAACGVLIAAGVTLLLERSLVRILVGVIVLGNGVNLLIVTVGGPAGNPPILGRFAPESMADPLPQAMVLTSIVITLGVSAFLLAMVHRSWQLTGSDGVQDDTEDRQVRLRARRGELSEGVRQLRAAYRRLILDQRAELARLDAARAERQALEETRRQELEPAEEKKVRLLGLREEDARRQRQQAAREKELRRRLRIRQREALKQMRTAIRAERERQALALDPELEGDED
ncbi:Na(+)/H(+) antiporter subunit C [Nonomuraea cavernae]|uniref:Na(+)/H(+) antiporter subunit C n=1 Tax=Nonomuraea cavernae TaxID=2045107 RepID=A0A918DG65_9ACTN|nr:Na(+)/H(+) antiporter subunit C [Nonomuraea cavernae]MCA2184294.1 Na(+)/H(+) antiporter subunit C [Nonomuraea cavernae]GGO64240.1 hypothetical protein GCM10012289_13200 [Nonomuraea cavernae]